MPKDKKPIIVNDPKDPKLIAYNDSLKLYSSTIQARKYLDAFNKQEADNMNFDNKRLTKELDKINPCSKNNIKPLKKTWYDDKGVVFEYKKPVQPYIYEQAEDQAVKNTLTLKIPEKRQIQNNSNNTTEIKTTPYYNIKYTKDNTGKVIGEEYLDFNNQPIQKMANGGIASTPQEAALMQQQQSMQNTQQADATYDAGMQAVGKVPVYGQAIAGIASIGDAIGKPIRANAEKMNPDGTLVSRDSSATGYIAGSLFNPYKSLTSTLSNKDVSDGQKAAAIATGGISNAFYAKSYNNRLEKNAQNNIQIQKNQDLEQNALENPVPDMYRKYEFANGGMNLGMNAEVESQENSVTPNGEFTQYNGPSHSQGGVKTNLQPGEMVFSDRLKMPGTKKTFAELNKINNTNKEDKVLEDSKVNGVKKLTAELMKKAKMKKSMELFEAQEDIKQSKLNNYAKRLGVDTGSFSMGGKMSKYPWGGTEDDSYGVYPDQNLANRMNTKELNEYSSEFATGPNPNDGLYGNDATTWNNSLNNPTPSSNGIPESNPSKRNYNWVGAASQLGNFAAQNMGNFYDLKRSNSVEKEKYNRVTPNLLDPTADLKYNDLQSRKAVQDVKNASNGNSSTYINARTGIANSSILNEMRIKQNYENMNAGIKNQATYYNAGLGDKETISNMQNRAQARNIRSNAISKIGQNSAGQYRDYKAEQMDDKSLALIAARYPEIVNDPNFAKYFKK